MKHEPLCSKNIQTERSKAELWKALKWTDVFFDTLVRPFQHWNGRTKVSKKTFCFNRKVFVVLWLVCAIFSRKVYLEIRQSVIDHHLLPTFTTSYQPLYCFHQLLPASTNFYDHLETLPTFILPLPTFTNFYQILLLLTKLYTILPTFATFFHLPPAFMVCRQLFPA